MFKRNFTLTELVFVLVIVSISLGLAITNFSTVLERAKLTTTLDVLVTLNDLFINYEAMTSELPNNLDVLADPNLSSFLRDAMTNDLILANLADIETQLDSEPTVDVDEAAILSAFNSKGITKLALHNNTNDATFGFSFGDSISIGGVGSGLQLFGVNNTVLQDVFNKDQMPGQFYFVLGIGNRASWINSNPGLQSAPVYQTEVTNHPEADIITDYSRFLVLLKLVGVGNAVTLQFVTCTYPHPVNGLGNSDEILEKLNSL